MTKFVATLLQNLFPGIFHDSLQRRKNIGIFHSDKTISALVETTYCYLLGENYFTILQAFDLEKMELATVFLPKPIHA